MLYSIEKNIQSRSHPFGFDKGKSFRSEIFEEYKAHRPPKSQGSANNGMQLSPCVRRVVIRIIEKMMALKRMM